MNLGRILSDKLDVTRTRRKGILAGSGDVLYKDKDLLLEFPALFLTVLLYHFLLLHKSVYHMSEFQAWQTW